MKRARLSFVVAAVLATGWPAAGLADFETGLDAYQRGDLFTARKEFHALAERGDANAQYNLAMLYLKRNPPDYQRAEPWLLKSARQGNAQAQYMYGLLAYYGVGVARDREAGLRWLERSRSLGNGEAKAALVEIKHDEARKTAARKAGGEPASAAELADLRRDLEKAEAARDAMRNKLVRSEKRATSLEARLDTLQRASVTQERAKKAAERERAELQARLSELQERLVEETPPAAELPRGVPAEPFPEQRLAGRILDIVPGGIVLTDVTRQLEGQRESFPGDYVVFVHLTATNGLSGGQKIEFLAEPAGPYRYRLPGGEVGDIPSYRAIGERPAL